MTVRRSLNLLIAGALVVFVAWTAILYHEARQEFGQVYTKEAVEPAIPMAHFKLQRDLQRRAVEKMEPMWLIMVPVLAGLIGLRLFLPRLLVGRRPHYGGLDNDVYHPPRHPAPIRRRHLAEDLEEDRLPRQRSRTLRIRWRRSTPPSAPLPGRHGNARQQSAGPRLPVLGPGHHAAAQSPMRGRP